ncbi:hypothetical protein HRH59_04570 [Rheinheimera sp. YQF-2]|uniref:Uncharacterized protein n=1 Tax=Rheinheimera lutimaris TaxID=2740584 RepID=A0A7Y5ANY8_9GAMM|nr:hypothetical protein [Rheinheimera lutimaris]NRQ41846.1 hypothetical protein [Rheinheimera lutimaris]
MNSRIVTYIFSGLFAAIFLLSGLAAMFGFGIVSVGLAIGYQPDFGELSVYEVVVIIISLFIIGLSLLGIGAPFFISIFMEIQLLKHCKAKGLDTEALYFKHPYSCRELHEYTSNVSDAWVSADAGKSLNKFVLTLKRIANFSFFSVMAQFMLVMVVVFMFVQFIK